MTALSAMWRWRGTPDAALACRKMLAAQRIYGARAPSDWDGGFVALARDLNPTVPEDRWDRQPLTDRLGRYALIADVRLDNRDELAETLGFADAVHRSDAEFLMAAWARWHCDLFEHILGDYAFCVWDGAERRMFMARDPLGSRPLHYHRGSHFLAVASMPKGLHALPEIPYAPDRARLAEFLALLAEQGSASFFETICKVEAGHLVVATEYGTEIRRHWNPPRPGSRAIASHEAVEAVRGEFDRAVRARLRRVDGPVATHLSAGLDSAAVTATAARLLAPAGQVVAFTAVPREGYVDPCPERRLGDEGPLASRTAALYPNIEHVRVPTAPHSPLDTLDRDFHLFDRPLLTPCNQHWIERINQMARQRGARVLLTGASGNMTISYAGRERLAALAVRGRLVRLCIEALMLRRRGNLGLRGAAEKAFGPWIPAWLSHITDRLFGHVPPDIARYSAVHPALVAQMELPQRASAQGFDLGYHAFADSHAMRVWTLQRVDMGNFNKGMLAGWGLDYRDPTADRRLVDLCLSLPLEVYLDRGELRALARRVFADRLPAAVLDERRRGMQAADWHEGVDASRDRFREELGRQRNVPGAAELLDLDRLDHLVADWPHDWQSTATVEAYRLALVRGTAVGHFMRKVAGSNG